MDYQNIFCNRSCGKKCGCKRKTPFVLGVLCCFLAIIVLYQSFLTIIVTTTGNAIILFIEIIVLFVCAIKVIWPF